MRQYSALEESNRRLVVDVYDLVLKPLDSSRVEDFFRHDYIQHNPQAQSGANGLKKFLDWAKRTSPKAEHHVKRIFVDGDFVIGHVHVIINPGDPGLAVADIFRIQDGKIAEHWDAAQPVSTATQNRNGMF